MPVFNPSSHFGVLGVSNIYVWNIIDLIESIGLNPILVANKPVTAELGLASWTNLSGVGELGNGIDFVTGVVRPESKRFVVGEGESYGLSFSANLISPGAKVSTGVEFGRAVVVRPFAIVDPKVHIGNHVTVGPGVIIGHHTRVGDYCHISNGAIISGGCTLESDVFIGSGAILRDGVTVGKDSIIGMGSVVIKDVPPGSVIVGNPAREV